MRRYIQFSHDPDKKIFNMKEKSLITLPSILCKIWLCLLIFIHSAMDLRYIYIYIFFENYKGQNKFHDHCLNLGPHKMTAMVAYAILLLESIIPGAKECMKKGSE